MPEYERQYKIAGQHRVPVTTRQKTLVGWRRLVGEGFSLFCCCECRFMTANATACYKERCDQSLYRKQARIRDVSNTKGPGKWRTTETLDKIKKTLICWPPFQPNIYMFRCWQSVLASKNNEEQAHVEEEELLSSIISSRFDPQAVFWRFFRQFWTQTFWKVFSLRWKIEEIVWSDVQNVYFQQFSCLN